MLPASLRPVAVVAAALLTCQSALAIQNPATAPAPRPVPQETIDQIESLFSVAQEPPSRDEAIRALTEHMQQILTSGQKVEASYRDAPNLYAVRNQMLSAALQLAALEPTQPRHEQVIQIAQRIIGSPAPAGEKLQADFLLRQQEITSRRPTTGPASEETRMQIQAFLDRYRSSPAAAKSLAYGVLLASAAGLDDLKTSLLDRLEREHGDQTDLIPFMLHHGRGKFSAKLTRLDGTALAVPGDIAAKVIVIDFWATWCGPCVAEAPRMKQIYEQFRSRGVQFLGISLDEEPGAKERVQQFAKDNGLNWVQTVSGNGWADPTARAYGVEAIPSIWVIDATGKIISSDARANLEEVLTQALGKQSAASAPAAR